MHSVKTVWLRCSCCTFGGFLIHPRFLARISYLPPRNPNWLRNHEHTKLLITWDGTTNLMMIVSQEKKQTWMISVFSQKLLCTITMISLKSVSNRAPVMKILDFGITWASVWGGYHLLVTCVCNNYRWTHVQSWKINQPCCVGKKLEVIVSSLMLRFVLVSEDCIRSFAVSLKCATGLHQGLHIVW